MSTKEAKHDDLPTPVTHPQRMFTITGTSNAPAQRVEYVISLDDKATFDMYQSAAFGLTAELMAKLGRIFTAAEHTGDFAAAGAELTALSKQLAE